ncbi:DUF2809 domain-containing protein [Microbacterium sp. HD4P20]|uniref:DUF2809 domain-containing protein n=1 Tax=Microbacterium sp. HD4P20 TaxID=2864874 RepID=UPI0020A58CB0|nr:DUF2809 domain-containing protein [Microbacterium sp. HD4P20]MCP2637187.1 DUF2809 domain-containing protein [Microbacterium sp. HD4P20]
MTAEPGGAGPDGVDPGSDDSGHATEIPPASPRDRAVRIRRISAAGLLAAVIVAGLTVHGLLADTAATDIAADALYAAAAYLAVVVLAARLPPPAIGGIAAVWCIGVELFQLTGLPLAWGSEFAPAMLLLGTVFDARDLVVYVVTIIGVTVLDSALGLLIRLRPS